jgi:hypothetical protein
MISQVLHRHTAVGVRMVLPDKDLFRSSINFLQPVGELASLGPTDFNKQVEYLQQRLETLRVLILEDLTVIGEGTLDELNDGVES